MADRRRTAPLGQRPGRRSLAPLVILGFGGQLAVRFVNALRIRIIARAQGAPLIFAGTLIVAAIGGCIEARGLWRGRSR